MAFKTTIAAGLAAVTLMFMPATQAEAKTNVVIGIGTRAGGGYLAVGTGIDAAARLRRLCSG